MKNEKIQKEISLYETLRICYFVGYWIVYNHPGLLDLLGRSNPIWKPFP